MNKSLLIIGCGFSGQAIAREALRQGYGVIATKRSGSIAKLKQDSKLDYDYLNLTEIMKIDWQALDLDDKMPSHKFHMAELLKRSSHCVICSPPSGEQDFLSSYYQQEFDDWLKSGKAKWLGYLSTTGVYGNHDGAWVDEESVLKPSMGRTKLRSQTEQAWQDIMVKSGLGILHIFRLAGIYGYGRNAIVTLKEGNLRRIIKKGQFFSRIHHEDIALITLKSMEILANIKAGGSDNLFNLADDYPCAPEEVIEYAAGLLGLSLPPAMQFETAELTPMQRSFYNDNKRVSNQKVKQSLGISLKFPNYKTSFPLFL